MLFVGDVMGRGVEAAAAMAQMRAAVRAYTAVDPDPASVLGKLDRMFAQFPTDQLVTLVYLVVDPARDEILVASAGPPGAGAAARDGSTEQLPDADGCPLGVLVRTGSPTACRCGGDTVLLFTDGLIERRDEDIDIGQKRSCTRCPRWRPPTSRPRSSSWWCRCASRRWTTTWPRWPPAVPADRRCGSAAADASVGGRV